MCIYLNDGDRGLDQTYVLGAPVFQRAGDKGHFTLLQLTLYQNTYLQEGNEEERPRLMILPVPSYCGPRRENDVVLLPNSPSTDLLPQLSRDIQAFADEAQGPLQQLYQQLRKHLPQTAGEGDLERSLPSLASPLGKRPVQEVGDYLCSVVHDPEDLRVDRLDLDQLGDIRPKALEFLRHRYQRSPDADEEGAETSEPHWKFLVCRVKPSVAQPRPIAYVHSPYRIDLMAQWPDMRMLSLFLPTVHFHPTEAGHNALYITRADFDHHVMALYGNHFAGVGEGVPDSMQQPAVEASTVRSLGKLIALADPPDDLSGTVRQSALRYLPMQYALADALPSVCWPFTQAPFDRWFALTDSDVLLWRLRGSYPNRDFYVKIKSDLGAFAAALSLPYE